MKNILFLSTDSYSSTLDRRITQQAELLAKNGNNVQVVLNSDDNRIQIHTKNLVCYVAIPRSRFVQLNTNNATFEKFRHMKIYKFLRFIYRVYKKIKKLRNLFLEDRKNNEIEILKKPLVVAPDFVGTLSDVTFLTDYDLIIAVDITVAELALSLRKQKGCSLIFDAHEFYSQQLGVSHAKKYLENLEKRIIIESDYSFVTNPLVLEKYKEILKLNTNKLGYLGNSLNSKNTVNNQRNIRMDARCSKDEIIFLYHGWLTADKGRNLENMILGFEKASIPNSKLIIMGQGDLRFINRLITKHDLRKIIQLPAIPAEEISDYIKTINYMVIPYLVTDLNNEYCFPNKLGDAIQLQIPVIANKELKFVTKILEEFNLGMSWDFSTLDTTAKGFNKFHNFDLNNSNWVDCEKLYGWTHHEKEFVRTIDNILL